MRKQLTSVPDWSAYKCIRCNGNGYVIMVSQTSKQYKVGCPQCELGKGKPILDIAKDDKIVISKDPLKQKGKSKINTGAYVGVWSHYQEKRNNKQENQKKQEKENTNE